MLQEKGFNLLELLIVMVLIAGMLMLSLRAMQRYRWQREQQTVARSAQHMLEAAQVYFAIHCQDDLPDNQLTRVSIKQLRQAGALPSAKVVRNPWGGPFSLVIDTTQRPVRLITAATFNHLPGVAPKLAEFRQTLGAKRQRGNRLWWSVAAGGLLPAEQQNLWVSGSGLASFTKQFTLGDATLCQQTG